MPVNGKKSRAIDTATRARIKPLLRKKLLPLGEDWDGPAGPVSVVCDVVSSKTQKLTFFLYGVQMNVERKPYLETGGNKYIETQ